MGTESKVWIALPILVTIVTGLAPIYVAYDIFSRGSIPERQLQLGSQYGADPLEDLSPLAERVGLSLTIGKEVFNNLVIESLSLTNTGKVPILPSDIVEPISVNVDPPWRIIAVEERIKNDTPRFTWRRISDQRFEAIPTLINPGDFVWYSVYLTDTRYDKAKEVKQKPKARIEARIVNMRDFSRAPSSTTTFRMPVGMEVYLDLPAWLFVLAAASLFILWYLVLLRKLGRLNSTSYGTILVVIGLAALSYASAEVIAYYIFGGAISAAWKPPSPLDWRANIHNWIVLATHVALSVWLYRKTQAHLATAAGAAGAATP